MSFLLGGTTTVDIDTSYYFHDRIGFALSEAGKVGYQKTQQSPVAALMTGR
jgi:hypothetical protein